MKFCVFNMRKNTDIETALDTARLLIFYKKTVVFYLESKIIFTSIKGADCVTE